MLYGDIGARLSDDEPPTPDTVIHTFDDESLAAYSETDAVFGFTDAVTRYDDGSSLVATGDGTGRHLVRSHAGLTAYPTSADEFSVWIRTGDVSDGGLVELTWLYADGGDDEYFARVEFDDDLEIHAHENGSQAAGETSQNHALDDHQWYELVVRWDDGEQYGGDEGEMTAWLRDADGNTISTAGPIVNDAHHGTENPTFALWVDDNGVAGTQYYFDEAAILDDNDPNLRTFVDTYDDGSLSEYSATHSDAFRTTTSQAHEGSHALELRTGSGSTSSLYSTSGLEAYPSRGDHFRVWIYHTSQSNPNNFWIRFAQQGSSPGLWNDGYYIEMTGDTCALEKDGSEIAGLSPPGQTTNMYDIPTHQWNYLDVYFDTSSTSSGEIHIEHRDGTTDDIIAEGSGTDNEYDSGAFGYTAGADNNYTYYVDTVEIID